MDLKVDKVVSKETKYIALGTMLLSVLMEAIFLIIGRWDYTVLLGNLLGASTAVFNFFLMGLAVQKAVEMDEEEAKKKMKTSLTIRTQMILIVALLGGVVPVFNIFGREIVVLLLQLDHWQLLSQELLPV